MRFTTSLIVLTGLLLGVAPPLAAQDDSPDVEALLERMRRLEAEVEQLKADRGDAGPDDAAAGEAGETAPAVAEEDTFRFDPALAEEAEEEARPWFPIQLPGSLQLTITGAIRIRGELHDPADYRVPGTFGRPAGDEDDAGTDFVVMRTRLGFELQVVEHLRAFVELQDSRQWGDSMIGVDGADLLLRQGWLEYDDLFGVGLVARAGRSAVPTLGDGRLVDGLDWSNVTRSWDAVQLTWAPEGFWFTAFAANLAEGAARIGQPFFVDRDENDDFWFSGVYGSVRLVKNHELDGYLFWRHLSDRQFASEVSARPGDRKDFTLGTRIKGVTGPLGYSGELAYQWGDVAGDRIAAWAAAVRTWGDFAVSDELSVGFVAEYAYASGDEDPTDGHRESFDPLLSFAHFYHGHMDLVLWQNIHALQLGVRAKPLDWLSLHADTHHFWLASREDAWYTPGIGPARRDPTGAARSYLGSELNLYARSVLLDEHLVLLAGFSHFFAGDYVRDTGRAQGGETGSQSVVYAQLEVQF